MGKAKLRLVIVTQEEPFYIPVYLSNTLRKLDNEIDVVKVYTLSPNLPNKNFLQTVQYYISYFGIVVFSYMFLLRIYYAISDYLHIGPYHSVNHICRKLHIPCTKVHKINSDEVLSDLTKLKPDVVLSIASPQIFYKKLISIPSVACLNIHSSLLPKYRGLNANFWVLAKGESTTGITIHDINPGIDDGDIVLQESVSIGKDWSLNDLYLKVMDLGSAMIATCLKQIHSGNISRKKNIISEGSYYSYPTRNDVKEFRAMNKSFFRYY